MNIKISLTICLGFGLLASCQQNKQTDDPEILKSTLNSYFDGLKNRDIKKLDEVTTGDFIFFEDGKIGRMTV